MVNEPKRKYFERGSKANREEWPDVLQQLNQYRFDCKATGDMPIECAMATALIAALRFADSFDRGGRQVWLGNFSILRSELRNLMKALSKEYERIPQSQTQSEPGSEGK